MCEGRAFQLWTDHKPLVTAISRVSAPISPRQQHHLAFISEFNVQILYLPGLKMSLPIFSPAQTKQLLDQSPPRRRQNQWISKRWPPSKTVAQKCRVCWAAHPLNWLSARQALNAWLEIFPQAIFAQLFPSNSEKTFLIIFTFDHNVAHPGRLASRRIISSRFVWRSLSSDVTAWARGCLAYQRGKIHRHTRLVPLPIPIPQRRFSHLHVDLACPLQYSNNFNYIFSITDRTSKWMEAIPLSETSAVACAKALTFTWISRFGVPETITSDRGPQFTSNLWFQLCEMLNISHKQTTAYHPESNGAVERLHRRLEDALPWRHGPRSYLLCSLDSEHS